MQTTSARLLRLLSLLQARPQWRGDDLAAELGVTPRTVRRDVERLRDLGYPVDGRAGEHGGYRLGPGAVLPPLLLDDDEAVAVALGLRAATSGAIAGIQDASVRAIAKLEQLLPSRLRHRVAAIAAATTSLPQQATGVGSEVIALLAGACHRSEALRFHYRDAAGEAGSRHVEPYRLVHAGRRWYLLAWDVARQDWRTFRLDRISDPVATGRRFTLRSAPDAATYVQQAVSTMPYRYHFLVRLYAPAHLIAERVPPEVAVVTAVDENSCELTTGADSLEWAALHIAMLGVDFEVREPPELVVRMAELAARMAAARSPRL